MIGESQQSIHKSPSLQAESAGGTGGPSKSPYLHSGDAEDVDGFNEHHGLSGDKDHGHHWLSGYNGPNNMEYSGRDVIVIAFVC